MRRNQMARNQRKMIKQKLMGLGVLACCALALWLCSTGVTLEDRDATAVVLLVPLGLYIVFSREIVIC